MVGMKPYSRTNFWVVGNNGNRRLVHSVKTVGRVEIRTEDGWILFPDTYLSFVGNHATIHPNPTPITKALNEQPLREVGDGA